jgi:hypothetical protein
VGAGEGNAHAAHDGDAPHVASYQHGYLIIFSGCPAAPVSLVQRFRSMPPIG